MPQEEHHDEYELVPMNPILKMERRVERIEKLGSSQDLIQQLMDIVRTNQQVVDDIVKINSDMISRVSILSDTVSNLTMKMQGLMEKLDKMAPSSAPAPAQDSGRTRELEEKLAKM